MGFFGNGGNSGSQERSEADELINKQFKQNQADTENKRRQLFQERLDIIKSQGNETWHPRR